MSGLRVGNSEYYYYRNGQGDIIGIIDSTGSIAAKYSYDAWGTPIAITDGAGNNVSGNAAHIANINPFRYRGYFYDVETGLYYLQSRYYDPQVGRFLNADGIIGANGYSLFNYCGNNPIMLSDPSGMIGWEGCRWMSAMEKLNDLDLTVPVKREDINIPGDPGYVDYSQFGSDRGERAHAGIDLRSNDDTYKDVYAMASGIVIGFSPSFTREGNGKYITQAIEIQSENGVVIRYCEISTSLRVGDKVVQGQQIGKMARFNAGTNNVMLHLEIYVGWAQGALTNRGNKSYLFVQERNYQRRMDIWDPSFVYDMYYN